MQSVSRFYNKYCVVCTPLCLCIQPIFPKSWKMSGLFSSVIRVLHLLRRFLPYPVFISPYLFLHLLFFVTVSLYFSIIADANPSLILVSSSFPIATFEIILCYWTAGCRVNHIAWTLEKCKEIKYSCLQRLS